MIPRILALSALLALSACAVDADGDGHKDDVDCDDDNAAMYPGAEEVCDGLDNDCSGDADDGATDAVTFYGDADGDGFGGDLLTLEGCEAPANFYETGDDCDDLNSAANPDATEVCDGIDNDCDGQADDDDVSLDTSTTTTWYEDGDGDGYGLDTSTVQACADPGGYAAVGGDCDDLDANLNPDTVWYSDIDGDGYGSPLYTITSCEHVSGYTADDQDCDDLDATINPEGSEVCDGADNDWDIDDDDASLDLTTRTTWYLDEDGDGYGVDESSVDACSEPPGYSAGSGDCDDGDATINPGEAEICDDGVDNNCNEDLDGCGLGGTLAGSDADYTFSGASAGNLGYDLATGDVDGDGYDDLLLPSYYEANSDAENGAGVAYLIYGPMSGDYTLSTDEDASFEGTTTYDYAGKALTLGDLDGDGYDDLAIGAYSDDTGNTSSGSVFVYYGGTFSGSYDTDDADAEFYGGGSSDYLGVAVKVIGDHDGDGYGDLAMGAYGEDTGGSSAGAVYLIYGGSSELSGGNVESVADAAIFGTASSDNLGYYREIADAGDYDADGYDDLVVAAKSNDDNGSSTGSVYVFFGGTALSGSYDADDADYQVMGSATSDYLGEGIAPAGDVDGDGYDELLMGADGADPVSNGEGEVYVFQGSATAWSGSTTSTTGAWVRIQGTQTYEYLGEGVAGGDVDGDGYADVLAGGDGYEASGSSVYSTGVAYLFYGSGLSSGTYSGSDADALIDFGGASYGYGGQALYAADLDGDGIDDVLAPAYGNDVMYMFSGGGY